MKPKALRLIALSGLLCLNLVNASPSFAAGNNDGNNGNNGNGNSGNYGGGNPPAVSATPELDSLALFGSGVAGILAYGVMRYRVRRPQNGNDEQECED